MFEAWHVGPVSTSRTPIVTICTQGVRADMVALGEHSGGARLRDYQFVDTDGGHLLRLNAPTEIVTAFRALPPGISHYRPVRLDPALRRGWTHQLYAPGRPPIAVLQLAELLTQVLTLPRLERLETTVVLDWYRVPGENDRHEDTELGRLVHEGKYLYRNNATGQARVGVALANRLAGVLARHPLLAGADVVLVAPGHDPRWVSFGARIGATVAELAGRTLVRAVDGTGGFRPPTKDARLAQRGRLLSGRFAVNADLTGRQVLVVDDFVSSGATICESARAAKAAGATQVSALAVVRTLRTALR